MIEDKTPKEDKELQYAHEMEKYDNSMPHTTAINYVKVEIFYTYDKNGERVYNIPSKDELKEKLCGGWDVEADEDGPYYVRCDCKQCLESSHREDVNVYAHEDLR